MLGGGVRVVESVQGARAHTGDAGSSPATSTTSITHGSLFSGIGGFDLGFERAGMHSVWQCEIKPEARAVLATHWPAVQRFEDVTTCDPTAVDVISFGSPCQDLSLAGRRAGIEGGRSRLFFAALRVIEALRPRLCVWENVRGALSSNQGRDFGVVLDSLADIGAVDIGWRVLDAQWFGVAQRRSRVFVVADFGGRGASEILSLAQGCAGGPRPSREAGEVCGALLASSVGAGGGPDDNAAQAGHLIPSTVGVRQLMPVERERLQGFPDEWTVPAGSDAARNRCLGNAVAVPVAQWIGARIVGVLSR